MQPNISQMFEKFQSYVCENFCVYFGSEFLLTRLILDLNSALDSIDRVRDLFREHWGHSLVSDSI